MGSNHSLQCNKVALDIWHWCMARNIWISAEHIARKCNEAADRQSIIISSLFGPTKAKSSSRKMIVLLQLLALSQVRK